MSQDLEKKLEECEKEKNEYLNGWKRAKADFINYKKEERERFENFLIAQQSVLMSELLAVLDSFDLGLVMSKGDLIEKKGVELIRNQLEGVLRKNGVVRIKTSVGDRFDLSKHEALEEIESELPEGTVVEVVEKGYMLHDKVLRPVKVKVSKGQSKKQN